MTADEQRVSDEILADIWWGLHEEPYPTYRAPLPDTPFVGRIKRRAGRIRRGDAEVTHLFVPSYFSATRWEEDGPVYVQLYFGSGVKANTRGETWDLGSVADDQWIEANDKKVPQEWWGPIDRALGVVTRTWPDADVRYEQLWTPGPKHG